MYVKGPGSLSHQEAAATAAFPGVRRAHTQCLGGSPAGGLGASSPSDKTFCATWVRRDGSHFTASVHIQRVCLPCVRKCDVSSGTNYEQSDLIHYSFDYLPCFSDTVFISLNSTLNWSKVIMGSAGSVQLEKTPRFSPQQLTPGSASDLGVSTVGGGPRLLSETVLSLLSFGLFTGWLEKSETLASFFGI